MAKVLNSVFLYRVSFKSEYRVKIFVRIGLKLAPVEIKEDQNIQLKYNQKWGKKKSWIELKTSNKQSCRGMGIFLSPGNRSLFLGIFIESAHPRDLRMGIGDPQKSQSSRQLWLKEFKWRLYNLLMLNELLSMIHRSMIHGTVCCHVSCLGSGQ